MYELHQTEQVVAKLNELYDNPIERVSKKSGLSRPTVSKFFNSHKIRPSSIELIYDACVALIEEKQSKHLYNIKLTNTLNNIAFDTSQTTINNS